MRPKLTPYNKSAKTPSHPVAAGEGLRHVEWAWWRSTFQVPPQVMPQNKLAWRIFPRSARCRSARTECYHKRIEMRLAHEIGDNTKRSLAVQ